MGEATGSSISGADFSGTSNVNFIGGSIDQFETTSITMKQEFGSEGPTTYGDVRTSALVNAIGLATGGDGEGTLTYTMQVYGNCIFSPSACSGPYFPLITTPGGTVVGASVVACPGHDLGLFVPYECFERVINFTFSVPFSFSFGMDTGGYFTGIHGTGYETDATEVLSFLSMNVSGNGTSVDFSLAPDVPEPATFGIGMLGIFGTVWLVAFRGRRQAITSNPV
jgi:hypothetical protein